MNAYQKNIFEKKFAFKIGLGSLTTRIFSILIDYHILDKSRKVSI